MTISGSPIAVDPCVKSCAAAVEASARVRKRFGREGDGPPREESPRRLMARRPVHGIDLDELLHSLTSF